MMRYHVNSAIVKGGTILARRDGFAPYFNFKFLQNEFNKKRSSFTGTFRPFLGPLGAHLLSNDRFLFRKIS